MLSSRARELRGTNFPPARPPGRPSLSGVASRSVRTGLQSRVPALVAGTPTRCPGLATQRPPVPRQPSHASSRGSQPRLTLGRRPLPLPGGLGAAGQCSPARWPSSRPRLSPHLFSAPRPRGGCPEVLRSSSLSPEGPSWLRRVNPLHAAVLHRFRYRRGQAAGISNKTQELVCDSSAWIPPVPKLSSRSFLGRSCPMFEPFLPREDGLKAATWGLFLVKEPLYFKGGDGACAGLSSCPIEELLMFTGYA